MALEDILSGVEQKAHIEHVDTALASEKTKNASETYDAFADYFVKYRDYSPADAQVRAHAPETTPKKARRDLAKFKIRTEIQLARLVQDSYDEVISNLSPEHLEEFAILGLKGKGKEYIQLREAMTSKNTDQMKAILAPKYEDDDDWAGFIATASKETLALFAQNYVQEGIDKFKKKNLCDETTVTEKGKPKKQYVVNPDKVKSYIRSTIGGFTKDADKIEAYNTLAKYLYQAKKEE